MTNGPDTAAWEFARRLLIEDFEVDPALVRPDASMVDLGLDSVATFELVVELEDHFDVRLSDVEEGFETLGEAVAIVDRLTRSG